MSAYVCYGTKVACVIVGGFAVAEQYGGGTPSVLFAANHR